jgi:hypothetical protein
METMFNDARTDNPNTTQQSTPTPTESIPQQPEQATICQQVKARTVEAVRDTAKSGVAVGKIVTVASAAGVVGVSNGIASSARAVANKCDGWSANLKGWILSR